MESFFTELKSMVKKIQENEENDKRKEWMGVLKNIGYDILNDNDDYIPNNDEIMKVFSLAVNDHIEQKVCIENKEEIFKLLQKDDRVKVKTYLKDKNWKESFKTASSPLDLRKILSEDVTQWVVESLIEHQFKIKWHTESGEPADYTYYEFCDHPNTTDFMKYIPRRAHVNATLYKECKTESHDMLKAKTKQELCPTVYINTTSGWKTWKAADGGTFKDANFDQELDWMNQSIKDFIAKNADKQNYDVQNNEDAVRDILEKPTLYWAVLEDRDFISGETLKLKEIGQTQVYVGKADNGIKGRWIKDGDNHCKIMKKCLDNACAMTTYDPLRLEGIQLVDARLTLAKVRDEKTALFLIKSFGDEDDKMKIAQGDFDQAQGDFDQRGEFDRCKTELSNATKHAEAMSKKSPPDNLEDAEKLHKKGKKKESNIIPYDTYDFTWAPKDMEYGMNGK